MPSPGALGEGGPEQGAPGEGGSEQGGLAPMPPPATPAGRSRPSPATAIAAVRRPDLEDLLGGRVLAWIGGAAVLVGLALLLALAITSGWLGEAARTLLAAAGSLVLVGAGVLLHERGGRTEAARVTTGTGLAGLFLALGVATRAYDLIPVAVGLPLAFAVGAVAVVLALRWHARAIAGLGIVGAILSPVLTAAAMDAAAMAFLLVAVGCATAVVLWRRWDWLALAGFTAATPQWLIWAFDSAGTGGAIVVLALFGGLNAIASLGYEVRVPARGVRASSAFLVVLNAVVLTGGGYLALHSRSGEALAVGWLIAWPAPTRWPPACWPTARPARTTCGGCAWSWPWWSPTRPSRSPATGPSGPRGGRRRRSASRRSAGALRPAATDGWPSLGSAGTSGWHSCRRWRRPRRGTGGRARRIGRRDGCARRAGGGVPDLGPAGARERPVAADRARHARPRRRGADCRPDPRRRGADHAAWALEAAALAGIARRTGDALARQAAFWHLGAAAAWALADQAEPGHLLDGAVVLGPAAAGLGAVATAALWMARATAGARIRTALAAGAGLALLYLASLAAVALSPDASTGEVLGSMAHQQGQLQLSALWAVAGVGALLVGLRRDIRALRLGALALLGLTTAKVFLFDLATLSAGYRVGSFIALGLLLLAGSFAYARVRPGPLPDLREVPEGCGAARAIPPAGRRPPRARPRRSLRSPCSGTGCRPAPRGLALAGIGVLAQEDSADIRKPGVQKPHCRAWARGSCWSGCSSPGRPGLRRCRAAFDLDGEHQARAHGLAVELDRARAADAVLAADVGPGQPGPGGG